MSEFGIYAHVPWCRTRCPYCAFNVHVDRDAPWQPWADGVLRDFALVSPSFGVEQGARAHSLYFGGGTPSLAPPELVAQVIAGLPLAEGAEITLEANPGTVDAGKLDAFRAAGVNRLSLGIQTFNADFAHLLNRGHTVRQAVELVAVAAAAGFRSWSVDVIFGLPKQRLLDFERDLEAILAANPPHVSLYGLTMEPGTPFGRAAASGRLHAADPDTWRAQYDAAVLAMRSGGWQRYEVSNFARAGHRAVHNEAVWRGGHYAGLGPGAHGFLPDGFRTYNQPDPAAWILDPRESRERPTPDEAAIDFVLSTLRHALGLPLDGLLATTGYDLDEAALKPLIAGGLLYREAGSLRLTDSGYPLADGVTAKLTDALRPSNPHR